MFLAIATKDSTAKILTAYARNSVDPVRFSLITLEGGSREIGELFGQVGKAGAAWLVNPDKVVDTLGGYSKYTLRKEYQNAGIDTSDCDDSLVAPIVRFLTPLQGDVFTVNSTCEIQWIARDSDGIASRVIYFSSDGGNEWELLDSTATGDSSYTWHIPTVVSDSCRIKVQVYDVKNNRGEKISALFSITAQTGIIGTAPVEDIPIRCKRDENGLSVYLPFPEGYYVSIVNAQGKKVAGFSTRPCTHWYSVGAGVSHGMHILCVRKKGMTVNKKIFPVR